MLLIVIYHIMNEKDYNEAANSNYYAPVSLVEEGFIHCSTKEQILGVANNIYKNQKKLCIIAIDTSQLEAELVFEDLYELGQDYPHIYGQLNMDAISNIYPFQAETSGIFYLPEDLKKR